MRRDSKRGRDRERKWKQNITLIWKGVVRRQLLSHPIFILNEFKNKIASRDRPNIQSIDLCSNVPTHEKKQRSNRKRWRSVFHPGKKRNFNTENHFGSWKIDSAHVLKSDLYLSILPFNVSTLIFKSIFLSSHIWKSNDLYTEQFSQHFSYWSFYCFFVIIF